MAGEINGILNHVSCRAMNLTDDGLFFAQKRIKQGGLSCVCFPNDSYGSTILDGIAQAERAYQSRDLCLYLFCQGDQFTTICELQLFMITKVQFQFHERGDVEKLVSQLSQLSAEPSSHLVKCQSVLSG